MCTQQQSLFAGEAPLCLDHTDRRKPPHERFPSTWFRLWPRRVLARACGLLTLVSFTAGELQRELDGAIRLVAQVCELHVEGEPINPYEVHHLLSRVLHALA